MPHKLPPDLVFFCSGSPAMKIWVYKDKKTKNSAIVFFYVLQQKTYSLEKLFFYSSSRTVSLDAIKLSCNFDFHSSPMQLDLTDLLAAADQRRSVLYEALTQTCRYTVRSALANAAERTLFFFHKKESVAPYWRSWWTWGFPSLALKQLIFHDVWSTTHCFNAPDVLFGCVAPINQPCVQIDAVQIMLPLLWKLNR